MFVAGVKFQREPSFPSYARLESGPSFHQQYNRGFPKHLCDDRSISCGSCRSAFQIFHVFCGAIIACFVANL